MQYNTEKIDNEILDQFYQKTLYDEAEDDIEDESKLEHMKEVLERLSNKPND